MRLVLSILLVIVLLVLGAYYWLGLKTEKLYEGFVEFNESSGYTVNKEYNKGLFSSTATLEAMVGPPSKSYYKFVQTDRIEHGPFPISNILKGEFDLSPVQAVIKSQWRLEAGEMFGAMGEMIGLLVDVPPVSLDTTVKIGGYGSSTMLANRCVWGNASAICESSSTERGASTNSTSAPASTYALPLRSASSIPRGVSASVRAIMTSALS